MIVAVIGPTDLKGTARVVGITEDEFIRSAQETGKLLAELGHVLVVVPDQGVATVTAETYKKNGGRKVVGIIPKLDRDLPWEHLHPDLCDEIIENIDWYRTLAEIGKISDIIICLGLSCGSISEIAWTKWFKRRIVVVRNLISGFPPEIAKDVDIKFVNKVDQLWSELKPSML